jgi:hypothetical protein
MRFRSSTTAAMAAAIMAALACLAGVTGSEAAPADPVATGPDGHAVLAVAARPLPPQNAPADQYFGRLKLSNLGVRNIIHALSVEGRSPLALPLERTRIMGVESAIAQWSDEYPRDTWLRGAMLSFAGVMAGKGDVDTDRIAIDLYLQTSMRFPNTRWSKLANAQLASLAPADAVDWSIPSFPLPDQAALSAKRIKL